MELSGAAIAQSSNQMFSIINEAQVKETDMANKIAVLAISETVSAGQSDVSNIGAAIDIMA
ncbi:hypothetical protein ACFL67_03720 [candidate division KSB1 bacterium]